MRLRLIAIGQKVDAWVETGFNTYAKRFSGNFSFELLEIPAEKRTKNSDTQRIITAEGEKILAVLKPDREIIALDVKGTAWSTEKLADYLQNFQQSGRHIDFIIGGPDGLSTACLKKAKLKWSLSPLTFPHPIVRILVVEQLYRAVSILQNHPYHRK